MAVALIMGIEKKSWSRQSKESLTAAGTLAPWHQGFKHTPLTQHLHRHTLPH